MFRKLIIFLSRHYVTIVSQIFFYFHFNLWQSMTTTTSTVGRVKLPFLGVAQLPTLSVRRNWLSCKPWSNKIRQLAEQSHTRCVDLHCPVGADWVPRLSAHSTIVIYRAKQRGWTCCLWLDSTLHLPTSETNSLPSGTRKEVKNWKRVYLHTKWWHSSKTSPVT